MDYLALKITDGEYIYEKLLLETQKVEGDGIKIAELYKHGRIKKNRLTLDSAFVNYLVKELKISRLYRTSFIKKWSMNLRSKLTLVLHPTKYDLIDYEWNERVFLMVREKCELEHALSWLSTLGGAFSALGDYFPGCADTAGKISIHQLKLALRLRDPNIAARCCLYLSLSLIQKKKFRLARRIIYKEYRLAKGAAIPDVRLLNMCRGIWSKLQYEYANFKRYKNDELCGKMHKVNL